MNDWLLQQGSNYLCFGKGHHKIKQVLLLHFQVTIEELHLHQWLVHLHLVAKLNLISKSKLDLQEALPTREARQAITMKNNLMCGLLLSEETQ